MRQVWGASSWSQWLNSVVQHQTEQEMQVGREDTPSGSVNRKLVMTGWASEDSWPPSVWTPYCSFGQRDKAFFTPTYSFTPHHHTNWTRESGGATLIFTTHLHPPATTIPTGNIISLHILCIQHNRVGLQCVCMGKLRCFLLCIHGGGKPVVKRVLKGV